MSQESASLIRIGSGGICFAYTIPTQDEFKNWHSTTSWFKANDSIPHESNNYRKIRWGKNRNAIGWTNFEEGALSSDGTPKLICKRCYAIIKHPNDGGSTTGMDVHVKSKACLKTSHSRGLPKLMNMDGWRATVILNYHKVNHKFN